jgi:GH24 family phage-related lysozyme (muramidase)
MRPGVRRAITPPLKQTEFDALVSFQFNCGEGVSSDRPCAEDSTSVTAQRSDPNS